jgi:hypothetical protein
MRMTACLDDLSISEKNLISFKMNGLTEAEKNGNMAVNRKRFR